MAAEQRVISAELQDKHQLLHYVTDMNCGTKKNNIYNI